MINIESMEATASLINFYIETRNQIKIWGAYKFKEA